MDGLLDTSDALSPGRREAEGWRFLGFPCSAFAVITAAVYFIAWYGAYSQLFNSAENMRAIGILSLGFYGFQMSVRDRSYYLSESKGRWYSC